jgi:hypothetical protein
VTQAALQSTLARLVTDRAFRDRVKAGDARVLAGLDLSGTERTQIGAVAGERGMEVTATLVMSFRLGKIILLLPFTRRVLGEERLAREMRAFWSTHPPVSFYQLEEAIAFCDHLLRRLRSGWRVRYLREVVAYERARLELIRVRPPGEGPPPQTVAFEHDPAQLLTCLAAGRRPWAIRPLPCALVISVGADGELVWERAAAPAAAPQPAFMH